MTVRTWRDALASLLWDRLLLLVFQMPARVVRVRRQR